MKVTSTQLRELISEITGFENEKINDESRFKEDLAMDSISMVDLISSLEEDYEIIIEQEKAIAIQTFAQLVDFTAQYKE